MSENSPPGGNVHLERPWKITMTPPQLLGIITGVLVVAGYGMRFEWFVGHTEGFETHTEHFEKLTQAREEWQIAAINAIAAQSHIALPLPPREHEDISVDEPLPQSVPELLTKGPHP